VAELVLEASRSERDAFALGARPTRGAAPGHRAAAPDRPVGTLRRGARLRDVTGATGTRGSRLGDVTRATGARGGPLGGWRRVVQRLLDRGWSRAAAEAGGRRWEFHAGLTEVRASDAAGAVVGEFRPRAGERGGGTLRWRQRQFELRTPSFRARRFELEAGERALAVVAHGRPREPLRMRTDDRAELDPGLLLFCAFVVRVLSLHHDADTGGA
jgi:hypothetical protein